MRFDRGWTDGQSSSDLRIVQSFNHQSQHFTLALCKVKAGHWRLIGMSQPGLERLLARAWRAQQCAARIARARSSAETSLSK